jgi:hypothetical protein
MFRGTKEFGHEGRENHIDGQNNFGEDFKRRSIKMALELYILQN